MLIVVCCVLVVSGCLIDGLFVCWLFVVHCSLCSACCWLLAGVWYCMVRLRCLLFVDCSIFGVAGCSFLVARCLSLAVVGLLLLVV